MAEPDTNTAIMLGEMRGQLRELIHQGNEQSMENKAVARTLAKLEQVPQDIAEIKERLTALETERVRRDTERGLLATALRSPLLAWLFATAVAVWTWWKGQGQ